MKIAVLLDPLHQLRPYKDSTVAMIKAAQKHGIETHIFTQQDLLCREGQAFAVVSSIEIGDEHATNWAVTEVIGLRPLVDYDIILMRKDPPFDPEYIYATYALDLASQQGVLVANHPQSLRDANEKYFTLQFSDCTPKTLVSQNMAKLREFWEQEHDVIYKPLSGMGGRSVFRVDKTGLNLGVILEVLTEGGGVTIMAQKYIPEIYTAGDKRILLINGDPVPYALARIPARGDMRGNLAAGARGEVVPINSRDRDLCRRLKPILIQKGLYFVGIDVIGDYLTEINVTSPTCIREIEAETYLDIAGQYIEFLMTKVQGG